MKTLIMSDIHGNIHALNAVLERIEKDIDIKQCILLGDIIDYGMYSNEVIERLKSMSVSILCNIWGNHEEAIVNNHFEHFSSDRGKASAMYTKSILNAASLNYMEADMTNSASCEFIIGDRRCLAIHGSLENEYWKGIKSEEYLTGYEDYDYVFSGHSHIPHFFERYYETDNEKTRNKKKVIFINPGSVGQPRNLNTYAQYAVIDFKSEAVHMEKVKYDILAAQAAYNSQVDEFYKVRLESGI